jgi:hypothetical protein
LNYSQRRIVFSFLALITCPRDQKYHFEPMCNCFAMKSNKFNWCMDFVIEFWPSCWTLVFFYRRLNLIHSMTLLLGVIGRTTNSRDFSDTQKKEKNRNRRDWDPANRWDAKDFWALFFKLLSKFVRNCEFHNYTCK